MGEEDIKAHLLMAAVLRDASSAGSTAENLTNLVNFLFRHAVGFSVYKVG
jgi:hypothetical protein